MSLKINLGERSYDIIIERGALKNVSQYLNLRRKVMIVTDSGVPSAYAQTVKSAAEDGFIVTVPEGEGSKSLAVYEEILSKMLSLGFDRGSCVVAVGGGVVGDLAGFCAASYMRGVDFYNIPTTSLAQIDSSIGGKTAVNLCGIKNVVGAFYQPKKVIIDADTLKTLPPRLVSSGLCEAVKMAATCDSELFSIMENGDICENIDTIIERSLMIKKTVVEKDELEAGLRRVLNFGHTIGHAIERENTGLYHGECVALGMLPMCKGDAQKRLRAVLQKLNLPTDIEFDTDRIVDAVRHDKKRDGNTVSIVTTNEIGTFEISRVSFSEFEKMLRRIGE